MSPLLWGFATWHFIHCIALAYPNEPTQEIKNMYLQFFEILPVVLPCPACSVHFRENMAKNPIRLNNSKELFEWTVEMHNFVNEKNGKKVLSYTEAFNEVKKNGDLFKEQNLFNNGINLNNLQINDPQLKEILKNSIEKEADKLLRDKLKSHQITKIKRENKLLKITLIGIAGYFLFNNTSIKNYINKKLN